MESNFQNIEEIIWIGLLYSPIVKEDTLAKELKDVVHTIARNICNYQEQKMLKLTNVN